MSGAQILNGKEITKKHLGQLASLISEIQKKGAKLMLATVRVGETKDTLLYAKSIERLFKSLNIGYTERSFPEKTGESDLLKEITKLNTDPAITGIMIFAPLPKHLNSASVTNAVAVSKDVEGRRILQGTGSDRVASPTALACLALIDEGNEDLEGKEAVIVGRSDVVGKPAALLLIDKRATVTVCNSKTKNLQKHIERADIVIATAGKAELIKGSWIKPGATVIDVGENLVNEKLVGDVEFAAAKERAGYLTPVPGGVGPLTNVMLVKNLLTLHKLKEAFNGNH